ncbi:hypothetical protein [Pseudoalteromonas sp. R3]|uniref:hypothetical protein n=1 Tax=Pseudoalteromonas sp. R3 TaxID=1709477 RepID=UPI0006B55B87|nr:hypothetical protein [Pseudoalteromonas sp. R3]AZZ99577.1 hypothetical protein ELR70_22415 [Pseudoalteromonas sp. R3]
MTIYSTKEYLQAELARCKDAELFEYEYNDKSHYFKNVSLKRKIGTLDGETIYDLESVYGYTGLETNITDSNLLSEAWIRYKDFCKRENIVAEFFRHNPLTVNQMFESHMDMWIHDRDTVSVPLICPEGHRAQYAKSLLRNIKKAEKNNLETFILPLRECVEDFYKLYLETMNKNMADEFYMFPFSYFEALANSNSADVFIAKNENVIVNMLLMLRSEEGNVYYHLGATKTEYYSLNGNPLLFDKAIEYYSNEKYKQLYLGGGTTGQSDDSLLRFKKKFCMDVKPFFISGAVYNNERYNSLVNSFLANNKGSIPKKMFLQYRA